MILLDSIFCRKSSQEKNNILFKTLKDYKIFEIIKKEKGFC